jgi:hypothetical protein
MLDIAVVEGRREAPPHPTTIMVDSASAGKTLTNRSIPYAASTKARAL